MDRFHFERANPLNGNRGVDFNARMRIKIDWAQALRECLIEDRRWNPID
jgi:hypothetical protein